MTFWRYQLLQMGIGLVLFVFSLPVMILATGLVGSLLPQNASMLTLLFPGLPWLIGMPFLTWKLTEKLSKRWSN